MFSTPRPQYVKSSELSHRLQEAVTGHSSKSQSSLLREMVSHPLPPDGQRDGKIVGFFDQGLITGATIVLTPVLTGIAVLGYYAIRFGLRRIK